MFTVYLIISILSFNPSDPSWSQVMWEKPIHNIGSNIGAWLADSMLFIFGIIAYFILFISMILILINLCHIILYQNYYQNIIDYFFVSLRLVGILILIITSCGLIECHIDKIWYFPSGGIIGVFINQIIYSWFSITIGTFILLCLWTVGFSLSTGWSWLIIAEKVGNIVISMFLFIKNNLCANKLNKKNNKIQRYDHKSKEVLFKKSINLHYSNKNMFITKIHNIPKFSLFKPDDNILLIKVNEVSAKIMAHKNKKVIDLKNNLISIKKDLNICSQTKFSKEASTLFSKLISFNYCSLKIATEFKFPICLSVNYNYNKNINNYQNFILTSKLTYVFIIGNNKLIINSLKSISVLLTYFNDIRVKKKKQNKRKKVHNKLYINFNNIFVDVPILRVSIKHLIIRFLIDHNANLDLTLINKKVSIHVTWKEPTLVYMKQNVLYNKKNQSFIQLQKGKILESLVKSTNSNLYSLISNKKQQFYKTYIFPTLDLLILPPLKINQIDISIMEKKARLLELCLANYRIKVKVIGISPGPVITLFKLDLAPGVKASRISSLSQDIARSLSAISVRVVEMIPGKSYVGLELPNQNRQTVYLREVLDCAVFQKNISPLSIVLGKDISSQPIIADIAKMPHLLVAGTTGSGKSVSINAMIISMLYKATPEEVRFIMIDPKMLELSVYEGIPHLLTQVVTDIKDATNALNWSINEMDRRYKIMSVLGVRNLNSYNEKVKQAEIIGCPIKDPFWKAINSKNNTPLLLKKLPYIVIIIDEFADLMTIGKKVEGLISRLAQKARAAGIHLVLATQRPSVNVITGLIKANIPTRIAFTVSSKIDSRTILDQSGAESLLGMGDMLYLPENSSTPIRVHGAFVCDQEVHAVVQAWKKYNNLDYINHVIHS
ncbi:hypothetical protein FD728_01890 [Pantoea sp. Aalb]|nr:hypothetical protein [Pantoea sp. Aalb]